MKNELVSVIVPIYNAERYIKRCIDSLINQTYDNLEIIIVNDGSYDKSKYICENYAKKDARIKLINKENEGVSIARNLGISHATGEYIMFVDADDYLDSCAIEKLISLLKTYSVDIVKMNYTNFYDNGKTLINKMNFDAKYINSVISNNNNSLEDIIAETYFLNVIWGQLIKTELVKNIKFNRDLIYGEDLLFNYQLLNKTNKIYITDYIGYFYYINSNGANQNYDYDKIIIKLENLIYIYSYIYQLFSDKKRIYYKFIIEINNNLKRLALCNVNFSKIKITINELLSNNFVKEALFCAYLFEFSKFDGFLIKLLKKHQINLYILLIKYIYLPLWKVKKNLKH